MIPLIDDPSTWAINQFELTVPQQEADDALEDHWLVAQIGGNRGGKSANLGRIGTKVCVGGYDWAPEPADICIISKAKHQAASALQTYLEQFILYGLPSELVIRRTTREELTSPIKFVNRSTLVVKTETMGWQRIQGAGYNFAGFDEFPDKKTWKEIMARVKAGCALKSFVAMTPTNGLDWFYEDLIGPALEGKRQGIAVISNPVFANGTQGCALCKRTTAQWEPALKTRNITRTWQFHYELKKLCPACHTFGVKTRILLSELERWEEEYTGIELGIRLYGAFLERRGSRCFTPAEIKALLHGCLNGEQKAGIKVWEKGEKETPYVGGVDAAEGLGKEHSETAVSIHDAVNGEQVALFADDDTPYHEYRETVDWLASKAYPNCLLVIEYMSQGKAMVEEFKDRGHLQVYRHRDENARGHVSGHGFGWRSHHESRDTLLRNCFAAIRRNIKYEDGVAVGMNQQLHPQGLLIRDRKTIEQLKKLFYHAEKGNRISKAEHQRDDRVFAVALAHEGRMHRRYQRGEAKPERTPGEVWQDAVISRRRPTYTPDVQLQETSEGMQIVDRMPSRRY